MEMTHKNDTPVSPRLHTWLWLAAMLCAVSLLGWSVWDDVHTAPKAPHPTATLIPASTQSLPAPAPAAMEISKIRPGMRVQAFNPEVSDQERAAWQQVDYKNWFALSVLLIGEQGEPIYLDLIRPIEWVLALDAQEGKQIWLEVPELNGRGWGRVTSLTRCKPIPPGSGRVVTGTFSHRVKNVFDLQVQGLDKPIGVTGNHPIWSEDRQQFVQAATLQTGERLRSMVGGPNGGIAHVTSITPRGPPDSSEIVHNLEVEGEHAYQISNLGLLVHNTYNEFEVLYRTMDPAHLNELIRTRKLIATGETSTTTVLDYALQYTKYGGLTVEFHLKPGTLKALEKIGVRQNDGKKLLELYGHLPKTQTGWALTNAQFKLEKDQISIQLGHGKALDIFNEGISHFYVIWK